MPKPKEHHEPGSNHLGVPARFKPRRDRRVAVRKVPCPVCKAEVDEYCRTTTGSQTTHPARRRMAVRAGF